MKHKGLYASANPCLNWSINVPSSTRFSIECFMIINSTARYRVSVIRHPQKCISGRDWNLVKHLGEWKWNRKKSIKMMWEISISTVTLQSLNDFFFLVDWGRGGAVLIISSYFLVSIYAKLFYINCSASISLSIDFDGK